MRIRGIDDPKMHLQSFRPFSNYDSILARISRCSKTEADRTVGCHDSVAAVRDESTVERINADALTAVLSRKLDRHIDDLIGLNADPIREICESNSLTVPKVNRHGDIRGVRLCAQLPGGNG